MTRPIDAFNLTDPEFVEVALPLPMRRTFTYRVASGDRGKVRLGARVTVPFRTQNVTAFAVNINPALPENLPPGSIRETLSLIDIEPLITPEILELTKWAAEYYAASWGEFLKASLPAGITSASEKIVRITDAGRHAFIQVKNFKSAGARILKLLDRLSDEITQKQLESELGLNAAGRAVRELERRGLVEVSNRPSATKIKPKLRKAVRLKEQARGESQVPRSIGQTALIETLRQAGGELALAELLKRSGTSASTANTLEKRGVIEIFSREERRDPLANDEIGPAADILLNADQQNVLDAIAYALDESNYKAFLLQGVTGSGKTEIYIRAMKRALESGRSSLMLVPEIALTPIFSRRLRAVFQDQVAILHSNLSSGERFDEWRRIRIGDARIVIGTRSAIFAPLAELGLLIVDEEHDTSYRQNESPFYNARDVAVMRAKSASAVVVLGSATPSLESYFNAKAGKYDHLQLKRRIGDRPLAACELIDMREVFRMAGKDVTISPQLSSAIKETHTRGEQSIVLLNRRGFSSFVLCRSCGESLRCRNCDITLTYHKSTAKLTCHYCGYSVATPRECPFCKSEFLYFIGEGTEQLEEKVVARFPELRIARIDRDSMSRRGEMTKTLLAFDRNEIDMLVGTQMLAKGHDFHNVTLVGVISVDTGLGLPDFRSAERTFQLLTQVAGRAGRGSLPGRVLIQTYYPEHYALQHAAKQDYESFYADEIKFRQRMSYPPFVALASIIIRHPDEGYARKHGELLKSSLDAVDKELACRILGPAPAPLARLKGNYRFQILLKANSRKKLRETLELGREMAETRGCDMRIVFVEIDPINLM